MSKSDVGSSKSPRTSLIRQEVFVQTSTNA